MQNKPTYLIESVDHALRLAVMLQQQGSLRLTDVSERLGVARSTAHRLLATLVYRDFARQDSDRHYVPGPALQKCTCAEPVGRLRAIALPHAEVLSQHCGETVNLQFLVGDHIRFIASVEPADQVLRVGNREGRMLPAHLASGGRAMLACVPESEVIELYSAADSPHIDVARLLTELRRTRRRGYAINNQATEAGVSAIGRALKAPSGTAVAALCVATPTVRFTRERMTELAGMLLVTAGRIERELAFDIQDESR
jgi:IclR family transcriptional regulator, acetate operon repressor